MHLQNLDPATDGRIDLFGIVHEIIRDLFLGGEGAGINAGKFQPRKPVMPGRAVGDQGIPAPCAPAFGNAGTLQHQMRHALIAEVFAHRHPGLTATHHKRIYFLDRHLRILYRYSEPLGEFTLR